MRSPLIGSFEISVDQNKQMISKTYAKVSQMLLIRAIYSISRLQRDTWGAGEGDRQNFNIIELEGTKKTL
jgi:hypothetical protein